MQMHGLCSFLCIYNMAGYWLDWSSAMLSKQIDCFCIFQHFTLENKFYCSHAIFPLFVPAIVVISSFLIFDGIRCKPSWRQELHYRTVATLQTLTVCLCYVCAAQCTAHTRKIGQFGGECRLSAVVSARLVVVMTCLVAADQLVFSAWRAAAVPAAAAGRSASISITAPVTDRAAGPPLSASCENNFPQCYL